MLQRRQVRTVPVEVVWSRLAREELIELYLTIGVVHQAAAERLYDRLEARARQLADQPRMGQRRPDIHPSGRVLVVHPYLLLCIGVQITLGGVIEVPRKGLTP